MDIFATWITFIFVAIFAASYLLAEADAAESTFNALFAVVVFVTGLGFAVSLQWLVEALGVLV